MNIQTVGILGCGTMGSGITIVCARAGLETIVLEASKQKALEGQNRVLQFFDSSVKRGKLREEEKSQIASRLHFTTEPEDMKSCHFIIEAVFEDLEVKRKTFTQIHSICRPDAIFATNTSVLSVTAIAAGSGRPDKVVGIHFCNPAHFVSLVEVTRGMQTSDHTYEKTLEFCGNINKTSVTTNDTPGFILNYFLIPYLNNCLKMLETGLAGAEDIDRAMKLGLGYKMGPFELLDIVGLDLFYNVCMNLYDQLKDPRFFPPPVMLRRIHAGLLGQKSGKGFYDYQGKGIYGA